MRESARILKPVASKSLLSLSAACMDLLADGRLALTLSMSGCHSILYFLRLGPAVLVAAPSAGCRAGLAGTCVGVCDCRSQGGFFRYTTSHSRCRCCWYSSNMVRCVGARGVACAPSYYLFFLPWTVESILDTMLTGRSTSNPASSSIPESSSAQLFALLRIPGRSIAVCKASHSRKYCSLCTWTNFPDFLLGLFCPFPSVSPRGREGGIFSIYPQIPFVRCMQPLHSYFS